MLPVGLGPDVEVDAGLLAPEEVGRNRDEAQSGEFVAGLADVRVDAEQLLQHDHPGAGSAGRAM